MLRGAKALLFLWLATDQLQIFARLVPEAWAGTEPKSVK